MATAEISISFEFNNFMRLMMRLRTLKDAPIKVGMRILVRTDFDVAVRNGHVEDEFRLKESLPTLHYILSHGAIPVIISHRGRPGGEFKKDLSMKPIAGHLEKLVRKKVIMVPDPFWDKEREIVHPKDFLILFENIRFWKGEEENSIAFARHLAKWGEIYVNDAFATSHRKHASLVLLPKLLQSYAGLHLCKEIIQLSKILESPKRPLAAIIGGAKLETKLPLIKKFLKIKAEVMVGGAAANVLLAAKGFPIKIAIPNNLSLVNGIGEILRNPHLHLPCDLRGRKAPFDVGPKTVRNFSLLLSRAKTVVWNGPLGLIEIPRYAKGTLALARKLKRIKAFKLVGGGDTIAILRKHNLLRGFDHVSTGGGAMLEFLAGKRLPGIEALKRQSR